MKRIILFSLFFQPALAMEQMFYAVTRWFAPKAEQPLDPAQLQTKLDRELLDAAQKGNEELAQSLLAQKANVLASFDGWTALKKAADSGHTSMCKILLDAGSTMKAERIGGCITNQCRSTPLMLAVRSQHPSTVQFFLDNGADVCSDYDEDMPLLFAAYLNNAEICKLIITRSQFKFHDLAHPNPTVEDFKELKILRLKCMALNASKMTTNPEILDILDLSKLETQFGAEIEQNIRNFLEQLSK